MELTEKEDEKRIFKNSIEYLHQISSFLKTPALKTVFNTKSRLMELRQGIFVPSGKVQCQRCLLNFHDGPAKYRIKKSKKMNKFAKKMKAKEQKGKPLTAYQRKFLKKFKYHEGNTLVIKCKFCEKTASFPLTKPKKVKPILLDTPKKKRKRKDKSCGLNKEVLRSIAPNKDSSVIVLDDTIVETRPNNNSVIVIEDSYVKTPKKAKKVASPLAKASMLARGTPMKPKNKNVMNTKSTLKDSPVMPKNKPNLKSKKKKNKKKVIETKEEKKKKKNLSKLGSLLKDIDKKSPSSKLKHFLQGI
ncbi:unnamed protein product [Callosobruchus maculatus]|uniref:Uncharacterized protein n=1 Tax=Callosobruchus maculatus TaxID=64391 RepID=A0A653BS49_CALMS|nr:unnamed protein product [Callosobruchus maculatus]